jgi:hypothetical protein
LRKNGRRDLITAIEIWNVSRVDDVLPRTNNGVEGWYRAFQSSSCAHPSQWKLIDHMKTDEALQLMTGKVIRARKEYRCLDERTRNIVQQYAVTSTMDYLCSTAHNLTF